MLLSSFPGDFLQTSSLQTAPHQDVQQVPGPGPAWAAGVMGRPAGLNGSKHSSSSSAWSPSIAPCDASHKQKL